MTGEKNAVSAIYDDKVSEVKLYFKMSPIEKESL